MTGFRENVQKTQFLTLNPRIKIFLNSGRVTFFTLMMPNFMQSFRKNQWAVSEISKDGRTHTTRAITKNRNE